jgi:hypothetical protein
LWNWISIWWNSVSDCPINTDNDGINNNIDIDNDNDGITNCTESYGDKAIPVSSPSGSVSIGNYSNSYIGSPTISGSGANTLQEVLVIALRPT